MTERKFEGYHDMTERQRKERHRALLGALWEAKGRGAIAARLLSLPNAVHFSARFKSMIGFSPREFWEQFKDTPEMFEVD